MRSSHLALRQARKQWRIQGGIEKTLAIDFFSPKPLELNSLGDSSWT